MFKKPAKIWNSQKKVILSKIVLVDILGGVIKNYLLKELELEEEILIEIEEVQE